MPKFSGPITLDNEVFASYILWSMGLVLKMIMMAFLTGGQRHRKKAYATPEDAAARKVEVVQNDPDVERVRRAHLNDIENIYLFFIVGFAYVLTDPNHNLAMWLFRIYGVSRIFHTVFYAIYPVRQPTRGILYMIGVIIIAFMTISTMVHFF